MNEAIDFNKFKEDLQKIDNYYDAKNYIRNQPLDLKLKRQIYHQNKARLENLSGKNKFNKITRNVIRSQEKLEKPLSFLFNKLSNSIQKNLGHETASYFYYSDWLLTWTIISYFPTIFCFVCIPHIIYWVKNYSIVNSMPNDDQIIRNSYCLKSLADFDSFNLTSLVQKSEFLNIVVFGCFPGDSNSDFGYTLNYSLQNAYLLSLIVFFLIWIFIIGSAVVKSISNSYIREIRIQNLNIFSSAIFCSWPFYSNDSKFIEKKRTQIINNLKMLKTGDKSKLRIKRVIAINLIFLIILAGFLTGMSYLILFNYFNDIDEFVSQRRVVLAAFLTIFNYLTPFICKFLSNLEKCPKSFETRLNLIRMYLMQHGLLGLIIAYIILNRGKCWEAEIGKQIYIFILFDFVFGIIDLIFSSIYLLCIKSEVVFNNSYYTINTLFSYLILWTGLYFSPYLGLLFIIFYIILFIIRANVVKKFYKPSTKAENVFNSETYVIMITLFSIFIAILILGGLSFGLKSSKTCGPFNDEKLQRPYDYLIAFQNYLYEVNYVGLAFRLILSSGMISFLLFVLSVLTYSMTKILLTYRKTVKHLKTVVESKKDERKKIYNTLETQNKQRTKINRGNKFEEEIEMITIRESNDDIDTF